MIFEITAGVGLFLYGKKKVRKFLQEKAAEARLGSESLKDRNNSPDPGNAQNNFETNSDLEIIKNEIDAYFESVDKKYQAFMQTRIDPLFGDKRNEHFKALSPEDELPKLSKEEQGVNRYLGFTTASLGLAAISRIIYPPLVIITVPGLLYYLFKRPLKNATDGLLKEHKVNVSVLDSVMAIWALLGNYIFAANLGCFLMSLTIKLTSKTKDISEKKLTEVFSRHPNFVWILSDGNEVEIPFDDLQAGDTIVMNAGEIIPADGTVIKGIASVDQQVLTGESNPVDKAVGDEVLASTVVLSGSIHLRAEKAGRDTVAAKISKILNSTITYKTTHESQAEWLVDKSTLPTLALSGLAYPVSGSSGSLAVLMSSIGYNMRILGPLSTLNFFRLASQEGILIKDGRALDLLGSVDTVIFDKTGTLTMEQLHVNNIYTSNGFRDNELLTFAAAAEYRQKHPVARAIINAAHKKHLNLPDIDEGHYEIGYGIKVKLNDRVIRVGSERYIQSENIMIPEAIRDVISECGKKGYSLVLVAVDNDLAGAVELHPMIRPEAKRLIDDLKRRAVSTYIISGDHEQPTKRLAEDLGVDRYYAGTLPEQKAEIVERLQNENRKVCFIGDGINDSIALKKADVSISLRGATTVAIDTAQIVLINEDLSHLTHLLTLAAEFEKNQKTNMWISTIPSVICTGGVFLFNFGIYTSFIIYYLSMGGGIINTMRPLINDDKKRRK
jgi:heavy metal translocating P-type ATPase